uniref:Solute carrier family 22 member 18-like n=1 Tax=Coturnix japonica TaxID=93934 RepID=A0A8C2TIB5_COTJA
MQCCSSTGVLQPKGQQLKLGSFPCQPKTGTAEDPSKATPTEAHEFSRRKQSGNDLIRFPLIFFFPSPSSKAGRENVAWHTCVLLCCVCAGGSTATSQGRPTVTQALLVPREWGSCYCFMHEGREEAEQSSILDPYLVVQGLVIGKLTSHCTEQTLLRFSILLFAGVGLGMALMRTVWHYCIIVVPLVFAFNVQGTITDSILTKAVSSSDTGAMLGICASVQPLTRTVGPTLGVILYRQFGVSSFGYLQLIVNAGLFVYLLKRKSPLRETKSHYFTKAASFFFSTEIKKVTLLCIL